MDLLLYALTCFSAGLLSFLSPCVLPLIPSYLCIIGGTSPGEKEGAWKPGLVAGTFSFILGFSVIFITLSIIFSATFSMMGRAAFWINIIAGAIVIVLGLHFLFNFLSFLNYEKRPFLKQRIDGRPRGFFSAFATGLAFGAGWTPCVGPVLAGILLLAAQSGGIPKAALFLACYSAGLGLPFLLASGFFNTFLKASVKIRPHLPLIRKISGGLMIVMGVMIITGLYQRLNAFTAQWQANRSAGGLTAKIANDSVNYPDVYKTTTGGASETGIINRTIAPEIGQTLRNAGLAVPVEGISPIDFTLPLLDGTTQTLSALQGSVVFLNFWATWCPPCRMEMPSMERLHQNLKNQGLVMLAVNSGETAEQAGAFMQENGLSFAVPLDRNGRVSQQYGVQAIPTTYIIDRRGLIIARMIGALEWDQPEIVTALETVLRYNP